NTLTKTFIVKNFDKKKHDYAAETKERYTDFSGDVADLTASPASFSLKPGEKQKVTVNLTVDPTEIAEAEQEYGWYYVHANIDGGVAITQTKNGKDHLWVPWHTVTLAASRDRAGKSLLDLSDGSDTYQIKGSGAGVSHADNYVLGDTDENGLARQFGEADITHIGARSFTGDDPSDGTAEELPPGTDELAELTWTEFLEDSPLTEPIEFGVRTAGVHNTTETLEIDVKIDVGADGNFADDGIGADFLAVKIPGTGKTCLYDLSDQDPFAACAAEWFPDYSNYNTNVNGIVVDAEALGLTKQKSVISYQVEACTGFFSGDIPSQVCDKVGNLNVDTGTYVPHLDVADPDLDISPLVCGGFWKAPACDEENPVTVTLGSATADEAPKVMVLFPNNAPARTGTVINTVR
ncbi:MAG: hypothetical protein QOH26_1661, partial [Actinomycetota bacterium]|nr:hypothetical protein [Actinomycetota bacterium]